MAVNTMTFNQLATVLTSIVDQATGKASATPVDTASFVSVAKTGLEVGYDPLATAVSQVLSRTIFSVRPYSRKFRGLEADSIRYGNHVRKINYVDKAFEEDDRIKLTDGQSIDQYKVNKPQVIQTNYYGENVYQKAVTIYRDQLDCAFSGPEEFARFLEGVMQNASDMLEQARESTTRATLANLISGHVYLDSLNQGTGCVIHLLTEYEDATGVTIDPDQILAPATFEDFAKFAVGRIKTLSKLFQERTVTHHLNLTAGDITRHTPLEDQRLFLLGSDIDQIQTHVLSSVFDPEYLRTVPYEETMFWQSIQDPAYITLSQTGVTLPDGSASSIANVEVPPVLGVLMDREAAGVTLVNQWAQPTPFNARGGYYNQYWHETARYWNDFTEKCVIFTLN